MRNIRVLLGSSMELKFKLVDALKQNMQTVKEHRIDKEGLGQKL